MASEFVVYFRLGMTHIADLGAYDHIVFLLALAAIYTWRSWKKVLWLVTAFTIGHSLTLALATLRIVVVDDALVEVLIPVTILVASAENLFFLDRRGSGQRRAQQWARYGLTALFGLIHGLGFSNFLRALLGAEESLFVPLLSFNIGLEIGQILIVVVVLGVATLVQRWITSRERWIVFVSGAASGIALIMTIERLLPR